MLNCSWQAILSVPVVVALVALMGFSQWRHHLLLDNIGDKEFTTLQEQNVNQTMNSNHQALEANTTHSMMVAALDLNSTMLELQMTQSQDSIGVNDMNATTMTQMAMYDNFNTILALEDEDTTTTIRSNESSLEINQNSTMALDIKNILHVPDKSMIVIYLKKERNCTHPQLIGRLSGLALAKIVWHHKNHQEDTQMNGDRNASQSDVLVGHYSVPLSGQYFLEIILIMCEEIEFNTDFSNICLADPSQHRITQNGVFIDVPMLPMQDHHDQQSNKSGRDVIGHWWYDDGISNASWPFPPLYTRYQPPNCRDSNATLDRCIIATNLSRFEPYQFKFALDSFDLNNILEGKQGKVCFIGASHARNLVDHSKTVASVSEGIQFDHFEINYVVQLTQVETLQKIASKECTKIIFGTGQWDLSFLAINRHPLLFPDYEETLSNSISLILDFFSNNSSTVADLFFRSMQ